MGRAHRHHFVPQFYLRLFSADGRRVHLYNFSRDRLILGASIKGQCARYNFHDFAPGLEEAFAKLEGEVNEIILKILETRVLPPPNSEERETLGTYIVFQKLRTGRAASEVDATTDFIGKQLLKESPELDGADLDQFEIRDAYPIAIPLKVAAEVSWIVSDLRMHLFFNNTPREFITSDDPVIAHNQYCEGITHLGVTGLNNRGLQLFWPISPKHLVMLFDAVVYKVDRADQQICTTTRKLPLIVDSWS